MARERGWDVDRMRFYVRNWSTMALDNQFRLDSDNDHIYLSSVLQWKPHSEIAVTKEECDTPTRWLVEPAKNEDASDVEVWDDAREHQEEEAEWDVEERYDFREDQN